MPQNATLEPENVLLWFSPTPSPGIYWVRCARRTRVNRRARSFFGWCYDNPLRNLSPCVILVSRPAFFWQSAEALSGGPRTISTGNCILFKDISDIYCNRTTGVFNHPKLEQIAADRVIAIFSKKKQRLYLAAPKAELRTEFLLCFQFAIKSKAGKSLKRSKVTPSAAASPASPVAAAAGLLMLLCFLRFRFRSVDACIHGAGVCVCSGRERE